MIGFTDASMLCLASSTAPCDIDRYIRMELHAMLEL